MQRAEHRPRTQTQDQLQSGQITLITLDHSNLGAVDDKARKVKTIQPFDLGHQALNTRNKICTRLRIMPAHLLLGSTLNYMSNSNLSQHGAEVCRLDPGKLCLAQISKTRYSYGFECSYDERKNQVAVDDKSARVSGVYKKKGTNSMSRRMVSSDSPVER